MKQSFDDARCVATETPEGKIVDGRARDGDIMETCSLLYPLRRPVAHPKMTIAERRGVG